MNEENKARTIVSLVFGSPLAAVTIFGVSTGSMAIPTYSVILLALTLLWAWTAP